MFWPRQADANLPKPTKKDLRPGEDESLSVS